MYTHLFGKYVVSTHLLGYRNLLQFYFDSVELLNWQKESHRQKSAVVVQGFFFPRRQSRQHLPNADVR